ncbi:unnamed protein product [Nezara viridula]|uniref:Neuropeptide n=1 Tax=Nezara viridula TaxID=85310 RepID=A0A9P0HQ75_NEZVI|nr:unnamed protein product [Nezara viridula]
MKDFKIVGLVAVIQLLCLGDLQTSQHWIIIYGAGLNMKHVNNKRAIRLMGQEGAPGVPEEAATCQAPNSAPGPRGVSTQCFVLPSYNVTSL